MFFFVLGIFSQPAAGQLQPEGEVKSQVYPSLPYPTFGSFNAPIHAEVFFHSLSSRSKKRLLRYIELWRAYPNDVRVDIRPVGRSPELFAPFFRAVDDGRLRDFLAGGGSLHKPYVSALDRQRLEKIVSKSNRRIGELGHSLTSTAFFDGRQILIREESEYRLHKTFEEHLNRVRIATNQGIPRRHLTSHFTDRTFQWDPEHIVPQHVSQRQRLQTKTSDFKTLDTVSAPSSQTASLSKTVLDSRLNTHVFCAIGLDCLRLVSTIEREQRDVGISSSISIHFAQFDKTTKEEKRTLNTWMRFFHCAKAHHLSFESVANALATFKEPTQEDFSQSSSLFGLSSTRTEACMSQAPSVDRIAVASKHATEQGIEALPTTVIGDVAYVGRPSYKTLRTLLYTEQQRGLISWLSQRFETKKP